MNTPSVRLEGNEDGALIMRSGRGDRYYVRLCIGPKRLFVYFHPQLLEKERLSEIAKVDATPDAPNPPLPVNWSDPWEDGKP